MAAPMAHLPPGVPPPLIPSMDPERFVSVGLANNFNGRPVSLFLLPRKSEKGKKAGTYGLSVELNIQADDTTLGPNHDGMVTEYMNADTLAQWVPSRVDPVWNGSTYIYTPAGSNNGQPATLDDYLALSLGRTPDGRIIGFPTGEIDPVTQQPKTAVLPPEDWKGYFPIPGKMCSRTELMRGTKWQQFLKEVAKTGYRERAPHINWWDFRKFLLGSYFTWVRVPFEFSGGQAPVMDDGEKRIETLCPTMLLDLGPVAGTSISVAVPAGVPVSAPLAPAPLPVVAPAAPVAPVAAPVQVTQPASMASLADLTQAVAASPLGGKDPAIVSAAANAILTALVAQWVAAGSNPNSPVNKTAAGTAVYEGLNRQGLDSGLGLRFVNDNEWMEGDERTFSYDAAKGLLLPLNA